MRNGRRDGRHAKRAPQAPAGPPAAWEPSLLNFPQLTLALRRWLPGSCASAILSALGDSRKQPVPDISDARARETEIKLNITDVPAVHHAFQLIATRPRDP